MQYLGKELLDITSPQYIQAENVIPVNLYNSSGSKTKFILPDEIDDNYGIVNYNNFTRTFLAKSKAVQYNFLSKLVYDKDNTAPLTIKDEINPTTTWTYIPNSYSNVLLNCAGDTPFGVNPSAFGYSADMNCGGGSNCYDDSYHSRLFPDVPIAIPANTPNCFISFWSYEAKATPRLDFITGYGGSDAITPINPVRFDVYSGGFGSIPSGQGNVFKQNYSAQKWNHWCLEIDNTNSMLNYYINGILFDNYNHAPEDMYIYDFGVINHYNKRVYNFCVAEGLLFGGVSNPSLVPTQPL